MELSLVLSASLPLDIERKHLRWEKLIRTILYIVYFNSIFRTFGLYPVNCDRIKEQVARNLQAGG